MPIPQSPPSRTTPTKRQLQPVRLLRSSPPSAANRLRPNAELLSARLPPPAQCRPPARPCSGAAPPLAQPHSLRGAVSTQPYSGAVPPPSATLLPGRLFPSVPLSPARRWPRAAAPSQRNPAPCTVPLPALPHSLRRAVPVRLCPPARPCSSAAVFVFWGLWTNWLRLVPEIASLCTKSGTMDAVVFSPRLSENH